MKTFLQDRSLTAATLTAALGLSSVLIAFTPAEARITFKAPSVGVPGRRVAGAARDSQCLADTGSKRLTAIMPQANVGLTTVANPVLLFYVPKTSTQAGLELVILDENKNNVVTKQSYKPSGKAGVVSIPLTTASLEVGKQYRWSFSVICNPKARSHDRVVEGAIKRIQPEAQLTTQLKNASPQQVAHVYAQAGIWQDSIATLASLLTSRPNDPELKADWEALLRTQGAELAEVVSAPLLQGEEAPQLKSRR
ncbi:hypothetical protein SAMD00079811_32630 [Scytonema sp. HK-05]|uniref:DUF928 domain-containing protein n=1 Tax=Scytonema sp. HK-05 TaxID=1137095 RepID=UPI000936CE73|nr:DUF928 domain-containing protein [Scytonema sp. HK-05]OKH56952.1 hypothetical protein NIES2130_22530 [Scytonema sp. HK-05]BAY45656.1 hypothetical protein SAMD00079811_32630 [Scytonema sp. HK-05]